MKKIVQRISSKRWLAAALGLALLLGAAGCGGTNEAKQPAKGELVDPPKAGSGTQASPAPTAAPAGGEKKATVYPLKVKDATGKEFTFEKAPSKIVSVSPSETETLFALGLGDKIAGVSDFCDYPEEAKQKPKMGSIVKPNEEALIAANADLVLSGVSLKTAAVEQLRGLNINMFKVEPKTIDDVMNNILMFGQIFDKQEQAEKVVASMKAERQKVTDAVKDLKPEQKKRVLMEFSPGWTVGKGEFLDELITLAGGINVSADITGYAQLNEEKVIADNPQVILYPKNLIDENSKKSLDQIIKERSSWASVDAIKNNRLAGVDKDTTSRPGPRITAGLVEIAKGIYPELVK
ncbi:ABC transporter substrate-binding protein [Paenibacillus doosanensis]|uniref:Vitamin B12-binding protein n=1 Tax=Paenibacillus konkukensis TaxID=2020716 RepID=A0ABY4RW31_9BACL|nr:MULTISPECIES: ABC transporter substrate-binding protein [Paenibacillus]MCS7460805.1 ABC transporter substrate-binding protein [Paenibacillus doosanensis]UQZ85985.1 Vitamin B12-binding protein precursor [Paenibacillus konkukensis]